MLYNVISYKRNQHVTILFHFIRDKITFITISSKLSNIGHS